MASIRDTLSDDEYYIWLVDRVSGTSRSDRVFVDNYYLLLRFLYDTPFVPALPRDNNRAEDGRMMRYLYLEDTDSTNITIDFNDEGCNLLEMFVGFATRMERDILHIDCEGDRTEVWFWLMLKNLGLIVDAFTDEALTNDVSNYEGARRIISRFMEREYKRNGEGGLFPMKKTKKDQREVEIWYQMNEYIQERGFV